MLQVPDKKKEDVSLVGVVVIIFLQLLWMCFARLQKEE
jgi:hypothetical protein